MIIFTPIQTIPIEFLEYKRIGQVVKFNLSSYYNDAPNLDALIPSSEFITPDVLTGDCSIPLFDIEYHNYILNNNNAFIQFMNIIIPAYTSPDVLVHIMIKQSPFRDVITESLLKLIQQRYGYNAYIINEIEDFVYADESDMSIPGLFTLDQDLIRWRSMMPDPGGDIYE